FSVRLAEFAVPQEMKDMNLPGEERLAKPLQSRRLQEHHVEVRAGELAKGEHLLLNVGQRLESSWLRSDEQDSERQRQAGQFPGKWEIQMTNDGRAARAAEEQLVFFSIQELPG